MRQSERFGLVLEPRPAQLFFIFEDDERYASLFADAKPQLAILHHISEATFGSLSALPDRLPDDTPPARLGWLRGPSRHGSAPHEHRTAILTIEDEDDRAAIVSAHEKGDLEGIKVIANKIVNNDACAHTRPAPAHPPVLHMRALA